MAPRAPDPHDLQRMASKAAPIIEVDRPCRGCGYNLRGLRLGINCPECGMPTVIEGWRDDPLSLMPMRVILSLVRGCWVASICIVIMVGVLLAERFNLLTWSVAIIMLAGLSVLWLGATFWLTPAFALPQAISRGFGPRSRTRAAARWLQLGWVISTGSALIISAAPNLPGNLVSMLQSLQLLGIMVGLTGVVVLSVLMEQLADWARDEDAQKMFNWAMWSWPIAMLLYVPLQGFVGALFSMSGRPALGAGLFVGFWVLAIGTLPYGLLMLTKSVTLSILHNLEYRDRNQRKMEQEQRRLERAGERAARTEAQPMRPKRSESMGR